jgi:hypothetical protein
MHMRKVLRVPEPVTLKRSESGVKATLHQNNGVV